MSLVNPLPLKHISRAVEEAIRGAGFVKSIIFGLITMAFIVAKLEGTVDWSWWWILAPLAFVIDVL